MQSKKIAIIFSCLFIVIMLNSGVSAYQKKMAVKDCLVSYNDDEFGAWNEATQTGVFLKITNNNLILGDTQDPDYTYTTYQPSKAYYNNFNSGGTSTIPYLKVREANEENNIYTKCNYKVGDYRIFFTSFVHHYGVHGVYLTHDFDLTEGLVTASMPTYLYTSTTQYNNIASPLSFYSGSQLQGLADGVIYVDNKVDSDHSASTLYNDGFYPNTEPTVISVTGLSNTASSMFSSRSLIRENGYQELFTSFRNFIYIDSDTQDVEDMLKPRLSQETFKNEDTGASPMLVAEPGDTISASFTFKNDFNIPLNNIKTITAIYSELMWTGGVGSDGTDVNDFRIEETNYMDFTPGQSKTISQEAVIPEDTVFPHLRGLRYIYSDSPYSGYEASWPLIGSDENDYLGFLRFDPRIELERTSEGLYQAVFNLTTELSVSTNYAYTPVVRPNEYALLAQLYLNEEMIDEFTIVLDDEEFAKMGVTELTEGSTTEYSVIIPIKNEYRQDGGQCYMELYSIKLTEPFKDKKIAAIVKSPYFKAGDIAYIYDNTLNFGSDSKVDSEKIIIFNPSFYENEFKLTVEDWSDETNFLLSWDGESFSASPTQTIHLYPLQSKEITFWVNATHNPWISSPREENLEIKVSTNLKTDDGTTEKTKDLDFILDMSENALNWININPIEFAPEVIFLDTLNSTKNEEITIEWGIEGSDTKLAELAGESYEVEITLIRGNDPDGEILEKTTAIFTIDENEKTSITFDFDFSYGEYLVILNLDSNNQIAELYSSGDNAEGDNHNVYIIPFIVTYCYYNEDGYMHRINFFGEDVIDEENQCECPNQLVTIPNVGYCADPYAEICSTFTTYPVCNNWNLSMPGLCGWEAEVSPIVTPGECLSCSNISNTCSGYNNKETCEVDPCYKATLYDCAIFRCDTTQTYGCTWDNDLNQCNFEGMINGNSCSYFGNIIQECNETTGKMIIDYSSANAGCESITREVLCGKKTIILSFFSKISLIIAITAIAIFYISRKPQKKNKRHSKHPPKK